MALYLLYRGIRDRRYFTGLSERLGLVPHSFRTTGGEAVWFHAVSVGEVLTATELIRRLRACKPFLRIHVSVTTLAGREVAQQKLAALGVHIFFAPLDYRSIVRRVLRRIRPALVIVLETEIWPNLYREVKRSCASLLVVNGRISDRTFPRYRGWHEFFCHVLRFPDAILVQSEEDRRRYALSGAPENCLQVAGNLKFDFQPSDSGVAATIDAALARWKPEAIWIAASTMPPRDASDVDEDDVVLEAFEQLRPWRGGLLLILAPRRPDRFKEVVDKLERAGISFVRRTDLDSNAAATLDLPGVLLLDSIGELAALFERADVVFMGGTLARRGGHNILEPAYFAKPIVVGPHMQNFADIAAEFSAAGAVQRIDEPGALASAVGALLDDARRSKELGERARELALAKRGVVDRVLQDVLKYLGEGVPQPVRTLAARLLLKPLSWIWRAGNRINLTRRLRKRRELSAPVISIGAITMGGAGKTPFVAHLAARLRENGRNPAILTRGYRRRSPGKIVVVPRGHQASIEITGDEAQMFVRAGEAHVGVSGHRYEAGRRLEESLAPDVFLLDDGFQHVQLARKHDLVLIDALDPLSGGMFPLGRLREPPEHLSRATAFLLTRVSPGRDTTGIERLLARYNAQSPVFRSRVVPREWVDVKWGSTRHVAGAGLTRVAAFCGLGNPHSFWRTVEEMGIEIAYRWDFGDHHRYRPDELVRFAHQAVNAGVDTLVTTEKDVMNLCDGAVEIVKPLRMLWLKIGVEIEDEDKLLKLIS